MSLLPVLKEVVAPVQQLFLRQHSLPASQVLLLYREPGVLSGYRPAGRPTAFYLKSMFQVNNETVNIWTHLLAIPILALKLYSMSKEFDVWEDRHVAPITGFILCCMVNALLSSLAHTVHSKSPYLHYTCFQVDYAGIGLYLLGLVLLFFHTSVPEDIFHRYNGPVYITLAVLLCWADMFCCCMAKLRYRRPYPFQRKLWQALPPAACALVNGMPLFLRFYGAKDSMSHHAAWPVSMMLAAAFFSCHLPEKWFPGKFDTVGQGHQVFHVAVTVAMLQQIDAAITDVTVHGDTMALGHASLGYLGSLIAAYLIGTIVIGYGFQSAVKRRIMGDLKDN